MSRFIPFDDNESIILLDICNECIKNELVRSDAVCALSRILRQLALNQGVVIDESYRSVKGISYQTSVMIKFLNCSSCTIPKSFRVAYGLSMSNPTDFSRRLWETLLMASTQREKEFFKYVIQNSPSSASDIYWSLQMVNEYAMQNGIVSVSIYDELTLTLVDVIKSKTESDDSFKAHNKKILTYIKQGLSLLHDFAVQASIKQKSSNSETTVPSKEENQKVDEKSGMPHFTIAPPKKEESLTITLEELTSSRIVLPTSFVYYGRKTDGIQSWKDMYVKFVRIIYFEHQKRLCAASLNSQLQSSSLCIANQEQTLGMHNPMRIADNVFIETDCSDDEILMQMKSIMEICGIPLKRLQILGLKGDLPADESELSANAMNEQSEVANLRMTIDNCLTLLSESFPNGFKAGSSIQQRKFRIAYHEKYGTELSESFDLEKEFVHFALYYSGKYYAVTSQMIELMRNMTETIPEEHRHIIFYSVLYNNNVSQLSRCGIYSAEMLKAALRHAVEGYYYEHYYFSYRKHCDLSNEIIAIYGDEEVYLSFEEICRRIPYAEPDQIRGICNRDSRIVHNSEAVYALESKIQIDNNDVKRTEAYLSESIQKHGYAFITKLCIENSIQLNPDISEQALQTVMFQRYFLTKYAKNRKLISPLGVNISINDVLSDFCASNISLTLYELEKYEEDLTGSVENKRSLNAAVYAMVRIDKDSFVNKSEIQFDVTAIDKAIEAYFTATVISLAQIKSFHAFPYIPGYVWNEFLLEGFLRHFSKEWAFLGNDTKDAVTGAIFRKGTNFTTYEDAMARAVVDAGIELTQEAVSDYLLKHKYRIRKGDMSAIMSKAYQITLQKE